MKTKILLLLLSLFITTITINAQEPNTITNDNIISSTVDTISIDNSATVLTRFQYTTGEILKYGMLGSSIGALAGFSIAEGDWWMIYPFFGAIGGGIIGVPLGAVRGTINYNKSNDKLNLFKKKKIGIEMSFNAASISIKGNRRAAYFKNGYYLHYRFLESNKFVPSIIRVGFTEKSWNCNNDYDYVNIYAYEDKFDISIFKGIDYGFLNPYIGLGFGLSLGDFDIHGRSSDIHIEEEFKTFFSHILVGSQINIFDLFFGNLAVDYEYYGFYHELIKYEDYSYIGNLGIQFSIGTYFILDEK